MAKSRAKAAPKRTVTPPEAKKKPAPSEHITTGEIRDLIEFIANTGLNEVSFETPELKLHVKRQPDHRLPDAVAPAAAAQGAAPPQAAVPLTPAADQARAESRPTVEIRSPMIGTFYRSSNPDSPPFVSVGDRIVKGQTVCIIEAMKLFNEIESEVSGTIVKALVENATPVEYDQPLYLVEPD